MTKATLTDEDRKQVVLYRIEKRTIFSRLLSLRITGDYEDRKNLDIDTDVKPLIEPTKELINIVCKMAKEKISAE